MGEGGIVSVLEEAEVWVEVSLKGRMMGRFQCWLDGRVLYMECKTRQAEQVPLVPVLFVAGDT